MSNKTKVLISLLVIAASVAVGRFSLPAKIVEKEKIVFQDRIVEKQVDSSNTTTNKHVDTIVTKKPDGTTITETKDDSVVLNNTVDKTDKTDTTKSTTDKEKTTTYDKGTFLVSASIKANLTSSAGWAYGAIVDKRVIGPFHMGAFGFTDSTFGMSVGIGF